MQTKTESVATASIQPTLIHENRPRHRARGQRFAELRHALN